jgi:hypothetical protein
MLKRVVTPCLVIAVMAASAAAAKAQWVIHALGGTVQSVGTSARTMTLRTDDGSPGDFKFPQKTNMNVSFDKDVRAGTMDADKENGIGHQVILFFFGADAVRTAIAVQDLGTGTFVKLAGTVVSFNKHDHTLTMQTAAGGQQTFVLTDKTVVDTADGVVPGRRFHAGKGDHLRLLAEPKDGKQQAILIRTSGVDSAL